mmetsp:Transcript_38133/g.110078  ORF Transcript_38133/g.110078 Transcript_38133/m.110078 type:complete len:217 (-) Transcript_38133:48-698(-)
MEGRLRGSRQRCPAEVPGVRDLEGAHGLHDLLAHARLHHAARDRLQVDVKRSALRLGAEGLPLAGAAGAAHAGPCLQRARVDDADPVGVLHAHSAGFAARGGCQPVHVRLADGLLCPDQRSGHGRNVHDAAEHAGKPRRHVAAHGHHDARRQDDLQGGDVPHQVRRLLRHGGPLLPHQPGVVRPGHGTREEAAALEGLRVEGSLMALGVGAAWSVR